MTREEAIGQLRLTSWVQRDQGNNYLADAIDMAIEALSKESILDKIRAEIKALPKTYPFVNHIDTYVKEDDIMQIIDKYKAESEE